MISPNKSPVMSVKFSPNSRFILATTLDGTIRLWDYMNNKCVKTYQMSQNDAEFKYSSIGSFICRNLERQQNQEDDDGPYIVQGIQDNKIGIWNIQTKIMIDELSGHTDTVLAVNVHPSQNGTDIS